MKVVKGKIIGSNVVGVQHVLSKKNGKEYGILHLMSSDENVRGYKVETVFLPYEIVTDNLIGKYNVYNLMCCIVVLNKLGFDMSLVLSVISKLSGPKGRMEVYSFNTNRIIVDYAHTPDAIKNVLSSVKNYNKLYVVFGCTGNRDRSKRPIMTQMLLDNCDHVIITSDDLYYEDFNDIVSDMLNGVSGNNYSICFDRGDAIIKGISYLDSDDILLVLGKGVLFRGV